MTRFTILIAVFISVVACNQRPETESGLPKQAVFTYQDSIDFKLIPEPSKILTKDTLYALLDVAAQRDSFDFAVAGNGDPFLYLQSGNFFLPNAKSAILIYETDGGKYRCEILSYVNRDDYTGTGKPSQSGWMTIDTVMLNYVSSMQIYLRFDDYNFDGKKDIYIQNSMSNGYGMSYGHLIIRNSNGGFTLAKQDLANMAPDKDKKAVISDELIYCYMGQDVCKLTNKWKGDSLITVKKDCPCKEDN